MRKVLFFLSIVLLTVGMSSCGKGYDLDKCKEFQENIKDDVKFNDDEYAEMLDQAMGLCKFLDSKFEDAISDLKNEKEYKEFWKTYSTEMDIFWDLRRALNKAELTSENNKVFKELEEANEKYQDHRNELYEKFTPADSIMSWF